MTVEENVYNEDNFKRIIEYAPIGIVIIDKVFRWRVVNKRFCEIIGYQKKELLGKTFLDITYKEDRDQNKELYEQLKRGEIKEYSFEKRYVRKDGRVIWARLTVAGAMINGEFSHLVALIQDVDETKRYQNEILYKNKELDTLFYKASHDLKSPIKTLEGLLYILKVENPEAAKGDTFQYLEETVRQLKTQNESLLQVVKINELDPAIEPVEPFAILKACATDQVNLTVKGAANLKIKSDPYFLQLIFSRLMQNSTQFASHERVNVEVTYKKHDKYHGFTYTDDAIGITKEIQDRIFEMFFKGHEQSKGSGLGLYIVKKAVEKLNGEIDAAPNPVGGTVFKLLLPLNT